MEVKAKGIDISKHNAINWSKVDPTEFDFVIIRAGFGVNTVDPQFKTNIENCIRLGIPVGIYWFSYASSPDIARQEADFCLKTIAPYKASIKYPVWFDWENDSEAYCKKQGVTPSKILASDMALAFLDRVKSAGYKVGNYSNPDYLNRYFDDRVKNTYPTWVAHVGVGGATKTSTNYSGKYEMWQYSWKGKFSGFTGDVDMNYAYVDYTGTAKPTTPVPAPAPEPVKKVVKGSKEALEYKASATYSVPADVKFFTDGGKNVVTLFSLSKMGDYYVSPHFQVKEFASKSGTKIYSDTVKIHNKLVELLEALYAKLDCGSIIINSGYRTSQHSVAIGGYASDKHTEGKAADIVCYDKYGKVIPAKRVCCVLEDMGNVYGVAYINERAVHVDTRAGSNTNRYFGDESKVGSPNITKLGYKSFHDYFKM